MKLNWQLSIVIIAAIAGLVAMIYFLLGAGWSEGGVAGMVTGIFTALGGLVLVLRNQSKQGDTLEAIKHQTNSLSDAERQEIADRAAVAVIDAFRRGDLR